jgi:hypothetical protein
MYELFTYLTSFILLLHFINVNLYFIIIILMKLGDDLLYIGVSCFGLGWMLLQEMGMIGGVEDSEMDGVCLGWGS